MSVKTKIEWTDATWNPVTGCTKVSEGCRNCYALTLAERFRGTPGHYFENGFDLTLRPHKLDEPLRWTKPRKIFVNSMSDLFHEDIPFEFIDRVFAVMALSPQHTFQVLTKRPDRMKDYLTTTDRDEIIGWKAHEIYEETGKGDYEFISSLVTREGTLSNASLQEHVKSWPLPNVWLGTSVENQQVADERIPLLLQTPAAVRFLSCEPLLGEIDLKRVDLGIRKTYGYGDRRIIWDALTGWEHQYDPKLKNQVIPRTSLSGPGRRIHWVIVGGESGHKARPMHPEWARSLRDQCNEAGVPFFFKQWGEWAPVHKNKRFGPSVIGKPIHEFEDGTTAHRLGKKLAGRRLDSCEWNEYPGMRDEQ